MTYDELKKIARALKMRRLRSYPGMDHVAIALNANPTDSEVFDVKSMVEIIESAGFEIKERKK